MISIRHLLSTAVSLAIAQASFSGAPVRLANQFLSVTIDPDSGAVTHVENKLTSATERVSDRAFEIELADETLSGSGTVIAASECKLTSSSSSVSFAMFEFAHPEASISLSYGLRPEDAFVLKQLQVRSTGRKRWAVRRCVLFDWDFAGSPPTCIPYYGTLRPTVAKPETPGQPMPPSDTSTAFFFRRPEGGLFTCVGSDFVFMEKDTSSSRCLSTYWPGLWLAPDEEFVSERGIIGTYRRIGYFHEPYHEVAKLAHFHWPDVDTRLDRAEIDAVSAAVRRFIRPGINYTTVNGWGLGVPHLIDSQEGADALKAAIDVAKRIPGLQGIHFVHGVGGLAEQFRLRGLATPPDPNPFVKQVYEYAQKAGLSLSIFVGISNNFPMQKTEKQVLLADRELLNMNANGKREPGRIAISRTYTDFIVKTVDALKSRYPIGGLTYDFLHIGEDHDAGHGWLPGRPSLHAQWANMRTMLRELRRRFPDMMLRGQIGWMHLGPWFAETLSLCHNSHDHNPNNLRNFLDFHIDHHFANNIRLSNWFANNCRMYPRYKMNSNSLHNGGTFRAWDCGAFRYCILSQMATSQVFGMFHNLPDEKNGEVWRAEDGEFFKRWLAWHKAHSSYYERAANLFGEPRPDGVDGYAYGNGNDSIVFLCNPTYQTHTVEVPVDASIHLPGGRNYVVRELYPEERNRTGLNDGVFAHGSTFVTEVPPQAVMVFEIKPDAGTDLLLTGISGEARVTAGGIDIGKVAGPRGAQRTAALRLPEGYAGPESVSIGGEQVRTKRHGRLLLAAVRFEGETIDPEVSDWETVTSGDRTRITATFTAPTSARDLLLRQKLPVSREFDTPDRRQETAWLDWSRFIVYVPACPELIEPDKAVVREVRGLGGRMQATALFNGTTVPVRMNFMGKTETGRSRFAGYFVDVSDAVRYGAENHLEVELPRTLPGQFGGIYLPNLTRETTEKFRLAAPPDALPVEKTITATPAFLPNPAVPTDETSMLLCLRLRMRAEQEVANKSLRAALHPEHDVTVRGGKLAGLRTSGDLRWQSADGQWTDGALVLGSRPTDLFIDIAGSGETVLQVATGSDAWKMSLAELLAAWRKAGDPFRHEIAVVPLVSSGIRMEVDLWAPAAPLVRVKE